MSKDEVLERLAEAVHKAYCVHYKKMHGKEYWTKGDYSLLDDETKEYDRVTVRAVFLAQAFPKPQENGKCIKKEL